MKMHDYFVLIFFLFLVSCGEDEIPIETTVDCTLDEEEISIATSLEINYAHPFESADPAIEETSFQALIEYLGETPIVGLGEATHGTREFFQVKDKLFRGLVKDKNFKAVIFEIPWGNALVVNDYVLDNVGTADEALNQTWYWVYDTQETRELAKWMRGYNESKDEADKIHFVGCDPQGPNFEAEKRIISEYLRDIDPEFKDSVYLRYFELPKDELRDYNELPLEQKQKNLNNVTWVNEQMQERRESYVSLTGEYAYERALMATHVIQHREMMYRLQRFGQTRDSLMAIYSSWWQRILEPEAKVAVWAHNLHVMDNQESFSPWMGTFLRDERGEDYKNVAFSFGRGCVNAFLANAQGGILSGVQKQTVEEIQCQTLNQVLSEITSPNYYLIFEEFDPVEQVSAYFFEAQPFYQMGAGFNYNHIRKNYTSQTKIAPLWDVLIHLDEVNETELR